MIFHGPVKKAHAGVAAMTIVEGLELSWLEFTDELVHGKPGRSTDKAGDLHCPVLKSSSHEAKAKIAMNLSF
ncbi:hypothetical protein C1H46_018857 [Malus baccata]|uniref:Uncharacterized protein n=1 Tax=Malus baccata TaxID=106549 RepID=A0A540M9W0_MALBA|nr:hypothetical protein C1H46_018857 [Malus baccata]